MKLMLANIDYRSHMTNEGDELQRGMEAAGWHLSGKGFDDEQMVPTLLHRHRPTHVLVHDKRDWDPANQGCYRDDVAFGRIDALADCEAFVMGVVKDAGSQIKYHQEFIKEIKADAILTYYHKDSILPWAPW